MKILQIIPHFYPALSFGGPVTFTYELCEYLVKNGHELTVYTTDAFDGISRIKDDNPTIKQANNFKVIYFPNISNTLAYKYNLYLTPSFYPKILSEIRNFDVIHIHEIYVFQNLFAAFLARKKKVPYVISAHGSLTQSEERGKKTIKKVLLNLSRKYIESSSRLIALTDDEKDEYIASGFTTDNISVLPSAVPEFYPASIQDKENFYENYNIKPNSKIILFLGRLHSIKRLDLLIESFKLVYLKESKAHLIIAGPDGGVEKKLKHLAKEILEDGTYTFTGFADTDLKRTLLSLADVFVMTSYSEGLSKSFLEASSAGIPTVITDTCCNEEMEKYFSVIKVKPFPNEIAHGISTLSTNIRHRNLLGKNAKYTVKENYSWERVGKMYEKLYQSVVQ